MLKLVLRKSDHEPMPEGSPWRQDSQYHQPGRMAKAIAKRFGGSADDYIEYVVPDHEKKDVLEAKELRWREKDSKVVARKWRPEEIEEATRPERKKKAEAELIDTILRLGVAEEEGLECAEELTMKKEKLKAQLEEIKEKDKKDK